MSNRKTTIKDPMSTQNSTLKTQNSAAETLPENILEEIAAALVKADYLDELIAKYQNSDEPDDLMIYDMAVLCKKIKGRIQKIEANWQLRKQAKAYADKKEHPTQDDSPNKNEGELINTAESEAA